MHDVPAGPPGSLSPSPEAPMGTAAAVILMKERRLVEAFERAGAVDPAHAIVPDAVGLDAEGLSWHRLHRRAVVRESEPGSGRFYLDREVWQATRGARRRMVLVVLLIAVALFVASYLATWGRAV